MKFTVRETLDAKPKTAYWDAYGTFESRISLARARARTACGRNQRFKMSVWDEIDLGPKRGGGRRKHKVVFWEAEPISEDLPSQGYRERFPQGTFDMKMLEGERPVPEDSPDTWHDVVLNLLVQA